MVNFYTNFLRKSNRAPIKVLMSTKIFAALLLASPIALSFMAQVEADRQYINSDMGRANFAVLKSAQEFCHAQLKVGQVPDCDELNLSVCETYSKMGEATMCSTFSDRIKAKKQ